MKFLSANDTKYGVGRLIDIARAKLVFVAKDRRPVVMMAVEEYESLTVGEIDIEESILAMNRNARSPNIEEK